MVHPVFPVGPRLQPHVALLPLEQSLAVVGVESVLDPSKVTVELVGVTPSSNIDQPWETVKEVGLLLWIEPA